MSESGNGALDIVETIRARSEKDGDFSLSELLSAVGDRGRGPFIFVPALVGISPLGGIPTVPTIMAVLIFIFAVQIVFGRTSMWIPDVLGNRCVAAERVHKAMEKSRGVARWVDRWLGRRMHALVSEPFQRLAAVACCLLCLTVPPLEFVPFAALIALTPVALFGLALTAQDGICMLVAFVAAGAAIVGAVWMMPFF